MRYMVVYWFNGAKSQSLLLESADGYILLFPDLDSATKAAEECECDVFKLIDTFD